MLILLGVVGTEPNINNIILSKSLLLNKLSIKIIEPIEIVEVETK